LYSNTGVACSILHIIAVFAFAILKLSIVATKYNPNIAVYDEVKQHLTPDDALNMDEIGF
jgi:hypothetical protein